MTRVVPLRRPWLWLGSTLVAVLGALVAISVFRNPNIQHGVIAQYQFAPAILRGLRTTIVLALLAALIGTVLGVLLAVMRISSSAVLRLASAFYTWLLRGTPLLVQILIWGNLALLFEYLGPFRTNDVMTPFVASVIALGLNEGAYMAEIVRAGIIAVDRGQHDASAALGMSTSLVSVIAGGDLLTAAENISSANLHTIELMLVATFWYLVLTTITSAGQYFAERRLGRSATGFHALP
jgi:polar amino acid transport system permease protein